jgi:ferredoxin-fold anticodon binding domain-containing protein
MEGDSTLADWTEWFQESLQQRFYDLSKVAEKQVEAILLLETVCKLLVELKNQTDIPIHDILMEWEAAITLEHSFEKE